jgi:DNA-binding MarR family transcriptional regulator
MHHELEEFDLGSGQFHFLMMLYRKDGINQENLAEELRLDKATSARAIKKLEDNGYITRKKDKSDRRCYNVYLTEKAKKIQPTIKKILRKWTKQLLHGFSTEEETQLYKFLERISENSIKLKK